MSDPVRPGWAGLSQVKQCLSHKSSGALGWAKKKGPAAAGPFWVATSSVARTRRGSVLLECTLGLPLHILSALPGLRWNRNCLHPGASAVRIAFAQALILLGNSPKSATGEATGLVTLARNTSEGFRSRVSPRGATPGGEIDPLRFIHSDTLELTLGIRKTNYAIRTTAPRSRPFLRSGAAASDCDEARRKPNPLHAFPCSWPSGRSIESLDSIP